MDSSFYGLLGIFSLLFALTALLFALPLAIFWEQDRWIFKGSSVWLLLFLLPLWFVLMIRREIFHAN